MAIKGFGAKSPKSTHIKGKTLGTSNEISFSVLDAKKLDADSSAGKTSSSKHQLGRIALFTMPSKGSVSSTPTRPSGLTLSTGEFVEGSSPTGEKSEEIKRTETPEEAEAKRKMVRHVSRFAVAVGCIAAITAMVFAFAYNAYQEYMNNQSYKQILNTALSQVIEADNTISQLDASFTDLLSDESLAQMEEIALQLDAASELLDEAEAGAIRAKNGMTDENDVAAADDTLETIAARREMISAGREIIDETTRASDLIGTVEDGWNCLIEADSNARTAISMLDGELDEDTLTAATGYMSTAIEKLRDAATYFDSAQAEYEEIDIADFIEYVDLRVEGLYHLMASCSAVIDEDVETARSENEAYNEYDTKAVALAETFETDAATMVRGLYAARVQPYIDTYTAAVEKAAALDTSLREYERNQQ